MTINVVYLTMEFTPSHKAIIKSQQTKTKSENYILMLLIVVL